MPFRFLPLLPLLRARPAAPPRPDASPTAWLQVLAAFLLCFTSLGLGNAFGAFQAYLATDLLAAHSPSAIAWIGATQGFLLSAGGVAAGALADRGHLRALLGCGAALGAAGLLGLSFARDGQYGVAFACLGVATGIAGGALYIPGLSLVAAYFAATPRLGLATAAASAGASVGGVAYPLLFRALLPRAGFAGACRGIAGVNAALLALAGVLVRPRDADTAGTTATTKPEKGTAARAYLAHLRDVPFLLFATCLLLLMTGVDVPLFFVPTFAQARLGAPPAAGDYLLAGLNAASLAGRLALGWLADRRGGCHLRVWQGAILVCGTLLFCWAALRSLPGAVAFVVVYGFFSGSVVALVAAVLALLTPDQSVFGARLGLAEGFQGLGFLVGPPVAGAIAESPAGYLGVGACFGGIYLVVLACLLFYTWRYGSHLVPKAPEEQGVGLASVTAAQ
ncbi:MFS general substrate transporter [Xylariomycetidae sp. FL0641]|nr:MFS general substrate transporter [Xylariomycetidae sp. FL0641]